MNAFDRWYAMTDCDFVSKDAARECWNAALDEAKEKIYGCEPQGVNPIGPLHSAGIQCGVTWAIEVIEDLYA